MEIVSHSYKFSNACTTTSYKGLDVDLIQREEEAVKAAQKIVKYVNSYYLTSFKLDLVIREEEGAD